MPKRSTNIPTSLGCLGLSHGRVSDLSYRLVTGLILSEIWKSIGPLSELVLSGTPVSKEDDFLLFKQLPHQGNGTFEAYHSWLWVPVIQEDGTFGGLWNATINTTKKVLAERRMASVREMGERTCKRPNRRHEWRLTISNRADNERVRLGRHRDFGCQCARHAVCCSVPRRRGIQ